MDLKDESVFNLFWKFIDLTKREIVDIHLDK